jgi:deoxyguanosine kinase
VVYLRATPDVLMKRIALRDRPYERNMERAYIHALHETYEKFFASPQPFPTLAIDTSDLDFVHNPQHLAWIENRLRERLGMAPYQPSLLE